MEKFYRLSVTYKEMNTDAREDFLKNSPELAVRDLYNRGKIRSYVTLITCLRIEFYIETEDIESVDEILKKGREVKIENGEMAIMKIFDIICGLDSVIVGEDQILSQMKKAFLVAMKEGHTEKFTNTIFNNAIALGKKFRNLSQVACKPLALENIAVKFIESHFDDLNNRKIFLIGIGDLSRAILFLLNKKGYENITITNRTHHKIQEIEFEYSVETVDFHNLYSAIDRNDIIISSTSAPHSIIRAKDIIEKTDCSKKRFILDLAMPRDVEAEVGDLENIELYNLDKLWELYDENMQSRCEISDEYNYLIEEQMEKLRKWHEKAVEK